MTNRKNLFVFLSFLLVAGCGTGTPEIDRLATVGGSDDAYFVIGLQPDRVQPFVFSGEIIDGKYQADKWARPVSSGYPFQGYIVGKAPLNRVYGIDWFSLHASRGSFLTTIYYPCGDGKTVVFSPEPGAVIYLTDVTADIPAGLKFEERFAAAQQFMKDSYPALAGKLKQGKYQLLQSTAPCT